MAFNDKDIEQFRLTFTRHYPRLVRMAVQMTGDKDEGRDIVADVMEQAWCKRASIDTERQEAWLYACVRNACINNIRRRKSKGEAVARLETLARISAHGDGADHERLLQEVEAAAEEMTEPEKTIVRLHYYEHLTYKETAERLGINPETVKKHIRLALKTLRTIIKR